MISIIYYIYYLFYKKSGIEDQPQASAIFSLSVVITIPITKALDFIPQIYCNDMRYLHYAIFVFVLLWNFFYFSYRRNGDKIVNQKKLLFGSMTLSVVFTICITILSLSLLFWFTDWIKIYMISKC